MKKILTALFLGLVILGAERSFAQCDLLPGTDLLNPAEQALMVIWLPTDYQHSGTLLYKLTEDGNGTSDFHAHCDGVSNTLTLIKTVDGYVFGGYNEGTWEGPTNGYYEGGNAGNFLFSVNNQEKWPIRPDRTDYGTYNRDTYGPTFGGGHDIYINDPMTGGYCYAWAYTPEGETFEGSNPSFGGSYNGWVIEEIEVWALSNTGDDLFCDTDGDGLSDSDEMFVHFTDPTNSDTDGDSLNDFDEIMVHLTNALDKDSDGDGLTDYAEAVVIGTDPMMMDSDSDGCDDLMFATYECEGQVLPECRADLNEDGTVDGLDLLSFLSNYGLECE
jgi:hypothetical protein